MERSRRANNPDNYPLRYSAAFQKAADNTQRPHTTGRKGRKDVTKKGKHKKGKRKWNKSKTYLRIATIKRNIERKKTAYAKSQNRRLVNEILRYGNKIKTEEVSVKG